MASPALISVRVKPTIAKRLKKLAKTLDRSSAYLAAEALEEYLDIHEWQIAAIQDAIKEADQGKTQNFKHVKEKWQQKLED